MGLINRLALVVQRLEHVIPLMFGRHPPPGASILHFLLIFSTNTSSSFYFLTIRSNVLPGNSWWLTSPNNPLKTVHSTRLYRRRNFMGRAKASQNHREASQKQIWHSRPLVQDDTGENASACVQYLRKSS